MVDFVCATLASLLVSILYVADHSTVRKVGGIWFARLGCVRVSFCIVKEHR